MVTKASLMNQGETEVHKSKDGRSEKSTNQHPVRVQRSKGSKSVYTQTPKNELSYELDRALYTFKENAKKTVPIRHQCINQKVRQHYKVYLPTIIDTKPRNKRERMRAAAAKVSAAQVVHGSAKRVPKTLLPICSCDFRPSRTPRLHQPPDSPTTATRTFTPQGPTKRDSTKTKLSDSVSNIGRPQTEETSDVSDQIRSRMMPSQSYVTPLKDCDDHVTPVLAIAIRRNAQDKDPIVQFNAIISNANKLNFIPFTRHISTQTNKSNVHIEFELTEVQ